MNTNEISALVKASIETKILEAFRSAPEYIDDLVSSALNKEVNEYGGSPGYHDRCKMPYLTWLVGDQIRRVAHDAVKEHVSTLAPQITEAVRSRLQAADIVDSFTKTIIGTTDNDWKIDVSFKKLD